MKIALLGYGKMGQTIDRLAMDLGHEVVLRYTGDGPTPDLSTADVAIEFSVPEAAAGNLSSCFEADIPVVCGTTGWLDQYPEIIKKCEASNGAMIYASNFSIGVNLLFHLNEYLARMMKDRPYGVDIEETHHTQKLDAPSGTAISLAEGIIEHTDLKGWTLGNGAETEIGINARRQRDVKGIHQVNYRSQEDQLSIRHEAFSRDGFGKGALLAANWLIGKRGVYTMNDVLALHLPADR